MADFIFKRYQLHDSERILVVPKMLRVCNSAHEPLHSPRTPKSPNAEVLRKQIVGMLNEDQGKENDTPVNSQSPMIYQIKRKGGMGTIIKPDNKTERQMERIKRSHLRFIRESNSTKTKVFPTIENYVLQGEATETGRNTETDGPAKRHWALPGDLRQESKTKNVRFHIQDEPTNPKVMEQQDKKEQDHSRVFCEVRGSAIQSNDISGGILKPSLRKQKTEAAKRQATIHTSLQLFKRRLKLNHESYMTPSMTTNHDKDYIIRRVPLKHSANSHLSMPRVSSAAKPVIEPRLSVTNSERPKSSITPCLNVQKTLLKVRPQSSPDRYPKEGHHSRSGFEPNSHNDNSFFQEEEHETVATVVNTYYVEKTKPKIKQHFHTSLSSHNLDVHNSLTSCPDARMKIINCDHQFDNRFFRWLQESSANTEEARRAAMRPHQEPPLSPLIPNDYDELEYIS